MLFDDSFVDTGRVTLFENKLVMPHSNHASSKHCAQICIASRSCVQSSAQHQTLEAQRTAGCNQFLCSLKRLICAAVHGWKTVVYTESTYSEPSLAEAICVKVNTCTKPVYFVGAKICGCNHAVVLAARSCARCPVSFFSFQGHCRITPESLGYCRKSSVAL